MSNPTSSYRPELPDWGIYLRWPSDAAEWIHPDDQQLALQLIPSRRVLRRQSWDGDYYHVHYGTHELRLRPSMWLSIGAIDLEVGQQVELLSCEFRNDPGIYRIADICYAVQRQVVEYYLQGETLRLSKSFARQDLRPLHVQHHLRIGYYQHPLPTADIPSDVEFLDVGDLTGE